MNRILLALLSALVLAQSAGAAKPDDWPRERMVRLLRELADEVFDRFVVQDPNRRVYGMTYEYVRDGKQVQDFGLDTMHDGAWFASAMVTAHRIDPEGGYLRRVQRFQVPFYVNVLKHSDRLFPHMIPREGQERFDAPIRGWAPRGWDDGPGIDLVAGVPFSTGVVSHPHGTVIERDVEGKFLHAYYTSSHHLLQDLADGLMNVWLTTHDPDVAEAILLIHQGRIEHGHRVPVVQTAAGLTNNRVDLYRRSREPEFEPANGLHPLWRGLVDRRETTAGFYDDGLAWSYGAECARAAISGKPIAPGFVAHAIGRVYCQALTTQAFYAPVPYRHGFTLEPRGVAFAQDTGRLARVYDGQGIMFPRGIQYAWIAAALLPHFRAEPDTWESAMRRLDAEGAIDLLREGASALGVRFHVEPERVASYLDAYILGTIDYWAGVREKLGYLPQGYFPDGRSTAWVRTMEMGAYAHLMKLIALRLMAVDGVTELELIRQHRPAEPIRHVPLPDSVLRGYP